MKSFGPLILGGLLALLLYLLFSERGVLRAKVEARIITQDPKTGLPRYDPADPPGRVLGPALAPISSSGALARWNCPIGAEPWIDLATGVVMCIEEKSA